MGRKYFLAYYADNESYVAIDLKKLPYFNGKNPSNAYDIIGFYNEFEDDQDIFLYLRQKGLIPRGVEELCLCMQKKNQNGSTTLKVLPHSEQPLVKSSSKFFRKDYLSGYLRKNLLNNDFVDAVRREFGFYRIYEYDGISLESCLNNIAYFNNLRKAHILDNASATELEYKIDMVVVGLTSGVKTFITTALFCNYYNSLGKPAQVRKDEVRDVSYENEEFLELNDIVKYNVGLSGKALEEALEDEALASEKVSKKF